MDRLLSLWPLYAPSAAIVGLGLGMSRFWGIRPTRIAIYVAATVLVIIGVGWALTTDSPTWVRVVNGMLGASTVSIICPKILISLCAPTDPPITPSDSR
jgi:hypothetical protein